MKTLRNVKRVELVTIPALVACVIPSSFKCVEDVKMENAGLFERMKELKEAIERKRREEEEKKRRREEEERRKREEEESRMRQEEEERRRRAAEEERLRKEREEAAANARRKAVISCKRDWDCVDKRVVESIEVSDKCCNEEGLRELDLSGFVNLKELKVGNKCFENVKEVKVIGLSRLESVEIGMNSFTKYKNTWYDIRPDPNRHFYVKNCPKLKSLKMSRHSFCDYTVIEIENVNALEVIEMGNLNDGGNNFVYASLELKSILIHRE